MDIYIKDIRDLEILKKSGLMKLCSRNHFFHGYWQMEVPDIKKKISSCITDGLIYYVPKLEIEDFKERYRQDVAIYL